MDSAPSGLRTTAAAIWRRGMTVSLLALVNVSAISDAATRHVRIGATGKNDGSDWVNAHSALPSVLVRGDTYYLADGSYGGYTFDDANSGTTAITIKKATVSDHGTDVGWSSSYGDGQAGRIRS